MRALTFATATAAALSLLGAGVASLRAAPPPGTIYYKNAGSLWRMSADGTGKTALPIQDTGGAPEPTYALHGGRRWFLQMEPVPAEGGRRLLAFPDDGGDAVVLVDDPAVAVGNDFAWTVDDGALAYDAIDFTEPGQPVGRVFRLAVDFDANGVPAASGLSDPVLETGVRTVGAITESRIFGLSFSPTADRLAFGEMRSSLNGYDVHVTNLSTGARSLIAADGSHPAWSPDGTKVLFSKGTLLATVSPSGSNLKTVAKADSWSSYVGPLDWAPDGSALVFLKNGRRFPPTQDVWTVLATGKSAKDLTTDTPSLAIPLAWR
jgi:hypothetical protein